MTFQLIFSFVSLSILSQTKMIQLEALTVKTLKVWTRITALERITEGLRLMAHFYAQDMLPLCVTFVLFLVLGMVSLRGVCTGAGARYHQPQCHSVLSFLRPGEHHHVHRPPPPHPSVCHGPGLSHTGVPSPSSLCAHACRYRNALPALYQRTEENVVGGGAALSGCHGGVC